MLFKQMFKPDQLHRHTRTRCKPSHERPCIHQPKQQKAGHYQEVRADQNSPWRSNTCCFHHPHQSDQTSVIVVLGPLSPGLSWRERRHSSPVASFFQEEGSSSSSSSSSCNHTTKAISMFKPGRSRRNNFLKEMLTEP